jgi:hypothetical protein
VWINGFFLIKRGGAIIDDLGRVACYNNVYMANIRTVMALGIKGFYARCLLMLIITTVLVIVCYFFVDRQFALWTHALDARHALHRLSPKLTLPFVGQPMVYALSSAVLILSLCLSYYIKRYRVLDLLTLMASPVIMALLVKTVLKYVFSRYSEYAFLHSGKYGFIWFHNYQSFPSGHMTILTAALLPIWVYWRKLGFLVLIGIAVEALTLITNFNHFVSDIVAGVYVGAVIVLIMHRLYSLIYPDALS